MADLAPPGHARVSSLVSGMAGLNVQSQQQQQQQQQTSATSIPSQLSPKPSGLAQYQKLAAIGEGTFGKVHKIVRLSDGEVLVWKELYYGGMNTKEKEQLVSEVNILRELNHKHVVKYFDRIIDREAKKIYIVMEYCSGGDVATIIKDHLRNRTWEDEEFIWKILTEVAEALAECHSKCSGTILHRDLKPANIFLDSKQNKCVKLGDFGLARTLKDSFDYAKTHVGTPFYMSPEQVMETSYNAKSDIWSLGCLIYELAALAPPFRAQNHLALATKIRAGVFERIPARYSEELQRLIRSMIQVEQQRRPTIEAILRHPRIAARIQAEKEREDAKKKAALAQQQAASAAASAAANAATASAAAAAAPSAFTPCASCAANSSSLAHAQRTLRDEAAAMQRRAEDLARREAAVLDRERKAREREMQLDKRDMQAMKIGAAGTGMLYRAPLAQLNGNQNQAQPSYPNLDR